MSNLPDLTSTYAISSRLTTVDDWTFICGGVMLALLGALVMEIPLDAAERFVRRRWPHLVRKN
jgi:hypothetical protein